MSIFVGSLIEISLNMAQFNQQVTNVWQYEVDAWPLTANATALAEAWWNHVKTGYRAIPAVGFGNVFRTIRVTELNNPVGDFAEWDIPVGEQVGTRVNPNPFDTMPPFAAAGVRLLVGTRATRPGQKRFGFLTEADNSGGILQGGMVGTINSLMATMTATMLLGAPAATATLIPIVCRKNAQGLVTAHQPITGHLVNTNVTTQNSRKFGRGV